MFFANALDSNCNLKALNLSGNGVTAEGWSPFSTILCDASSINITHISNHNLGELGLEEERPARVNCSLALNRSSAENKRRVAIKKILKHHRHLDMQPFFEWDLKVLPIAINWFEGARSIEDTSETGIGKAKFGAIYQFIRAMPEIFDPAPASGGKRKRNA